MNVKKYMIEMGQCARQAAVAEATPIDRPIFRKELNAVLGSFHVPLSRGQVQSLIKRACERGLLRRESKNRLAFAMELLRRWVSHNHPLESLTQAAVSGGAAHAVADRHLAAAQEAQLRGDLKGTLAALEAALEAEPDRLEARLGAAP